MADIVKGVTLQDLQDNLNLAKSEYSVAHRKAKLLDALDRNKLWETIRAKFPSYQLLPQTNDVSYIKNNILASVYCVGKSAQIQPTSENDKDIVAQLNVALDYIWDTCDVSDYEMQAGERAALLNLGITQVGWDNDDKRIALKNIDPLKFYRDPNADSLEDAAWCVTWEDYHKTVLAKDKACAKYLENDYVSNETMQVYNTDKVTKSPTGRKGYHRLYTWFVRTMDGNIAQITVLDGEHVVDVVKAIKPNMFPFAELYCNLPAGDLLGTSEPAKIFDNSVVYNLMNSIIATSEYKNQRPPRFISANSGINVNAFVKHGNDSDRTFVVQGDASKAVHYHQFPQPSGIAIQTMAQLKSDMQQVTGVDGRYTGRNTGSVTTTGGVQEMLDQATVIDTPKIRMYEKYTKYLSKLIISNYICNSKSRDYMVKDTGIDKYKMVSVDFPKIPDSIVFNYAINISSEMPKNKARLASMADAMMEKQMQYQGAGIQCDLIDPEEWLMFQDIPNKEYMLERMGIQKSQTWTELVAQAVTQYASLVDRGLDSANAIATTAENLRQQQSPAQTADMQAIADNANMFQ